MLKLELQYFGHLMWRTETHLKRPWCWERLTAEGERDDRAWDDQMASPTQCPWVWVSSGSWWWTERPGVLHSMGLQSQTWLSDWTELNWTYFLPTRVIEIKSLITWVQSMVGKLRSHKAHGVPQKKESTCQCRGRGFNPRSRKIPHPEGQWSRWATMTEPLCPNSWGSHALEPVLCTREATTMRSSVLHCN